MLESYELLKICLNLAFAKWTLRDSNPCPNNRQLTTFTTYHDTHDFS